MKKLIFLIILIIPLMGFSQGVMRYKFIKTLTVDNDSVIVIPTSLADRTYKWNITYTWSSLSGDSCDIVVQQSGNSGTNYVNYYDAVSDSLYNRLSGTSGAGCFEDEMMTGDYLRLRLWVGTGESYILNAWITFKP